MAKQRAIGKTKESFQSRRRRLWNELVKSDRRFIPLYAWATVADLEKVTGANDDAPTGPLLRTLKLRRARSRRKTGDGRKKGVKAAKGEAKVKERPGKPKSEKAPEGFWTTPLVEEIAQLAASHYDVPSRLMFHTAGFQTQAYKRTGYTLGAGEAQELLLRSSRIVQLEGAYWTLLPDGNRKAEPRDSDSQAAKFETEVGTALPIKTPAPFPPAKWFVRYQEGSDYLEFAHRDRGTFQALGLQVESVISALYPYSLRVLRGFIPLTEEEMVQVVEAFLAFVQGNIRDRQANQEPPR